MSEKNNDIIAEIEQNNKLFKENMKALKGEPVQEEHKIIPAENKIHKQAAPNISIKSKRYEAQYVPSNQKYNLKCVKNSSDPNIHPQEAIKTSSKEYIKSFIKDIKLSFQSTKPKTKDQS